MNDDTGPALGAALGIALAAFTFFAVVGLYFGNLS